MEEEDEDDIYAPSENTGIEQNTSARSDDALGATKKEGAVGEDEEEGEEVEVEEESDSACDFVLTLFVSY